MSESSLFPFLRQIVNVFSSNMSSILLMNTCMPVQKAVIFSPFLFLDIFKSTLDLGTYNL